MAITIYEVYSKELDYVAGEYLIEAAADEHVSHVGDSVAKRAVETDKTTARIKFNERFIGKKTGSRTNIGARGSRIRTSYSKDVTKEVRITGLEWVGEKLIGKAKVSNHMLTLERTLNSWWTVVSSEKISK